MGKDVCTVAPFGEAAPRECNFWGNANAIAVTAEGDLEAASDPSPEIRFSPR